MFDAHIFPLENEFAEDFQFMNSYLYLDLNNMYKKFLHLRFSKKTL